MHRVISQNAAPVVFLLAYFLTIVLGNILYATPWGADLVTKSYLSPVILTLPGSFSLGYWALLLCPFVVTPLVVFVTKRLLSRRVEALSSVLPEFAPATYFTVAGAMFAIALFMFWSAGAASLFIGAIDASGAVESRFLLHSRLGFFGLVLVQAILPFLSYLATVKAFKERTWFWRIAAVVAFVGCAAFLLLLNMKWPLLLFFCGSGLAVYIFSIKRPYLKIAGVLAAVVVAYLVLSIFVTRGVYESEVVATQATDTTEADEVVGVQKDGAYVLRIFESAAKFAPEMTAFAINRMAYVYPYYYSIFTENPGVCGNLLTYLKVGADCRPSIYVYSQMFSGDNFEGRGTAGATVHVTGYALGGWPVALAALVAASFLMGLLSCIPVTRSATAGSAVILGAVAGYHWSQLPGEGPLLYDHGLIWPLLLIVIVAVGEAVWRRMVPREGAQPA